MGRILKSDEVKLEGRLQLDVAQAKLNLPKGKSSSLTTGQVRIVENHPEFAVIEVTCSCGSKTYVKCEYADAESPEGSGTIGQVSEQMSE